MPGTLNIKTAVALLSVLIALALAIIVPAPFDRVQAATLGIVLVTLTLWATSVVPNYLGSMVFFAVVLILHLAKPDLVFSGFASAAVWLIISGFVIGSAINISGIGDRMAGVIAPHLTGSYVRLIGGLVLVATLLGFLMPSSIGRAVALVPIGMALAHRVGFAPGSNGRIGIAVTLAVACNMPGFTILPSNIPNMVLTGAAETIYGTHFGYLDYLMLHFPILGVLKSAAVVLLVVKLFPATVGEPLANAGSAKPEGGEKGKPAQAAQPGAGLRVSIILLITLALWATDKLHGINPAWIGLGTAVILLMPKIGVVPPPAFKASADFGSILFVAGALALGAVVNTSGLGTLIGSGLLKVLPLEQGLNALNFFSLSLMSFFTGFVTTTPGVPAVLTPLAKEISAVTGFNLETVLMTQVVGFSTVVFPFQVAPLVVAMQLSGEKLGSLLKLTAPLAAITLIVLLPLDYLWWALLGWF